MLQQQLTKIKVVIQEHIEMVFKTMAETFIAEFNRMYAELEYYYQQVSQIIFEKIQSIQRINRSFQSIDEIISKLKANGTNKYTNL